MLTGCEEMEVVGFIETDSKFKWTRILEGVPFLYGYVKVEPSQFLLAVDEQ